MVCMGSRIHRKYAIRMDFIKGSKK